MAEEVEMTPVEMTPVDATEPPKVNPLAKPVLPSASTQKTVTGLRPGLKLPPKPGATVSALKPGLKLPPKPGATVITKPLIRKPGEATAAAPLPKPVIPVDAQGVAKLPTVEAKAIGRDDAAAIPVESPKPMETLKSVTQKLKGITQAIPQQAILRKTGIISESAAQTDAQKEAAKHKTARISLSDAMGVAPVKDTPAPMKTIRIKRPVNLPGATDAASSVPPSASPAEVPQTEEASLPSTDPSTSVTQRKTLKITRPGGAVRPTGKFGVKKAVSQATAVAKKPADAGSAPEEEVSDIPEMPVSSAVPVPQPVVAERPGAGTTVAVIFKLVATVAIGALVWFLVENAQLPTYCGGLGWGQ